MGLIFNMHRNLIFLAMYQYVILEIEETKLSLTSDSLTTIDPNGAQSLASSRIICRAWGGI